MRTPIVFSTAAVAMLLTACGGSEQAADWPAYAQTHTGQRFSPLTQINKDNVANLKLAWQYGVEPADTSGRVQVVPSSEVTPIMVGGLVYFPEGQSVVALRAETGEVVWNHDLGAGAPRRGVTYWEGDAENAPRIIVGTADAKMVALDAATGDPIAGFGDNGVVDIRPAGNFPQMAYRMSTPGAVYQNLIITGAGGQENNLLGPNQDIRAWNLRTGELVWTFHLNPLPGEPGSDTWPEGSSIDAGTPGAWGAMSVDTELGMVFLPVGQPGIQYYGGQRPGANMPSSSVMALDAATGEHRWTFQMTHHDIWDYDTSAIPSFIDIVPDGVGDPVKALVAINKASLMFFLNRETGEPIYPVEERPVPGSDVPGEAIWPTQPFPVKPEPLARLGMTADDLFTGEPEHEQFCRDLVEQIGGIHNAGAYTPYSDKEYRIIFPGQVGGVNYGGVAIDTNMNYVFVNSIDEAGMGILQPQADGQLGPNAQFQSESPLSDQTFMRSSPLGAGTHYARFWDPAKQLPCQQPPWARLSAVNANTGEIAWQVPLGTMDEMEAAGLHNTGSVGPGGPMATAGGLVFIGATIDRGFRAFDSSTGEVLWETKLDSGGHANPMTYMGSDGKQYVLIVSSGINAFALE